MEAVSTLGDRGEMEILGFEAAKAGYSMKVRRDANIGIIGCEETRDSVQACIFDIERFSTEDGPGIRTSIFFKG